mgnify:CR=1 FL=1
MKQKTSAVNQITEGVIWKQLLLFFFPIMLGTLFQQLYNTADAIIVGRFVGKEALACVGGSSGQLINLVVGFFVGLSSGATVIIARYYGAKNKKELNLALHTASALAIIGSIIITVFGILLAPAMLRFMNTPSNVMTGSVIYLRIYFAGIFFVFVYNIGSAILRAMGDSKRPLYYLIVCCFINVFLDIFLVVGFNLGITGAALATLFSQAVSAILVIRALMKPEEMYQLELKKIRLHRFLLFSILTIGLPAGFQSMMYNIANIIIQSSLNHLGTDAMAAYTAFGKMDAFYWMISGAFSVSIATFVGQNYGAGKMNRVRKGYRASLWTIGTWGLIITLVFVFAPNTIATIFFHEPKAITIAVGYLIIIGFSEGFMCIELTTIGALSGLGMTRLCSIISIIFTGSRIPLAIFLKNTSLGLHGIWWAFSSTSIIKGIIFVCVFFWVTRKQIYETTM